MKNKKNLNHEFDLKLLKIIKKSLNDEKIIDLKIIDIKKRITFANYIIVGSGSSNRHIISMAKKIIEKIKKELNLNLSIEGLENSEWILIDADSIIINLFKPETRKFYNLEKIWEN